MIDVTHLSKRYGSTIAVDDLSFHVHPGCVTGFLGPNGSGKSTTMRIILGLDLPTSGTATIGGQHYRSLPAPLFSVGALLDPRQVHPGRTAANHLRSLAVSHRIPRLRVDEVLDLVGLTEVAGRRAGGFSLGMSQRLGIAGALLGDPPVLLLDEPVNGLDTDGIRWIRRLLRRLAAEGRTVLISSHVLTEMELTADRVVVVGHGRLIIDTLVDDLLTIRSRPLTRVRCAHFTTLLPSLERTGAHVDVDPAGGWRVTGPTSGEIGEMARAQGVGLEELSPIRSSLEDVYAQLTETSIEYPSLRDGASS